MCSSNSAKQRINRRPRPVLAVRPKVRVGVQRLGCRFVTETVLGDLHRHSWPPNLI